MDRTGLCRDALSDDVRTASVHLWFSSPVAEPAWWFQRLSVRASSDASYFATNGNSFGYGGFQEVESSPLAGRCLFSIWDQGCDADVEACEEDEEATTVMCGPGVTCTDFGGEGTGRKSYLDSPDLPVPGEPYYFVTHAAPAEAPGRMRYA